MKAKQILLGLSFCTVLASQSAFGQCAPVTSLFENFDSYETGNIVPNCWTRIVGNDSNNLAIVFGTVGNPAASGSKMLYQYAQLNSPASGTIAVLPEFSNVNAGTNWLKFKSKSTGAGSLDVGYVTDVANASTFVNIKTISIKNTVFTAPDATYSVAIPSTVPANARLAIRNYGTATGSHYIDDVSWETLPACVAPTDIAASEITKNSAKISWTASVTSPGNGYEIYYSTNNTYPTSATPATITGITGNSRTLSLAPSTAYYVWVRSACSGSESSDWTTTYVSLSTLCDYASISSVTGATVCPDTAATLSVAGDAGATFTWYDAATGGNVVGTGSSFTTPPLASTTTYYVSSSATASVQSVGLPSPSPLSTNTTASGVSNVGILFDAHVPFTLESVTLYPILQASSTAASLPGTVKIDVLNAAGTIVHTKTVSFTAYPANAPVAQIVNLGFPMIAGTNYRLRLSNFGWSSTGIAGFKIENGVANPAAIPGYPFALDGIVTLKSGVITAPPTNTPNFNLYHFFYDWKISTKCESPRVPVTATVGCLAVLDNHTKELLKLYPNPFKDILSISNVDNVKSISIIDTAGRVVKTIGKASKDINLSELKSGLYLVNLHYNDGSMRTVKVMKQ